MLVLTREVGESIRIGDTIAITVVRVTPTEVRLGIEAPSDAVIYRQELAPKTPGADSTPPDESNARPGRRGKGAR